MPPATLGGRTPEDVADVARAVCLLRQESGRTGEVRTRTKQHAVSGRLDCDRTVINGAQNLDEHRGLQTNTE